MADQVQTPPVSIPVVTPPLPIPTSTPTVAPMATPVASVPPVATNVSSSFPSIKTLFSESWGALVKNVGNLFVLLIITFAFQIGLWIFLIASLFVLGAGSNLFNAISQKNIALFTSSLNPGFWVAGGVVLTIFIVASIILGIVPQLASIFIVGQFPNEGSLGEGIKRGFKVIFPFMLTSFIVSFLTLGGFFFLIIPVLLFAFLFMFVNLEVILDGRKYLSAIKHSAFIVQKHFGEIFVRIVIYFLLYIIIAVFIPNVVRMIDPNTGAVLSFVYILINLLLSWFGLAYSVTLYKHARAGFESEKGKPLTWVWIIAILGWLLVGGLGFLFSKTIISSLTNEIQKGIESTLPKSTLKNIEVPKSNPNFDRSTELFKQIREISNQITATNSNEMMQKLKILNDENISELKLATEAEPNNAKYWYNLGSAYTWTSTKGTLDDGLLAYQNAEKIEPTNVTYINGVGDMLLRLGKYDQAILQFQKTLRISDRSGYAYYSLGQAYEALKVYDSAKESYQKAIDVFTSENSDGTYDNMILEAKKALSRIP